MISYIKDLFKGRVSVYDFWLGIIIVGILLAVLATIPLTIEFFEINFYVLFIFTLFFGFIASFIVRRLHDLNKSGWLSLLSLIPGVNSIFFIYISFWIGKDEINRFGSPPDKKTSIKQRIFCIR